MQSDQQEPYLGFPRQLPSFAPNCDNVPRTVGRFSDSKLFLLGCLVLDVPRAPPSSARRAAVRAWLRGQGRERNAEA